MLSWQDLEYIQKKLSERKIQALSMRDVRSLSAIERALDELKVADHDIHIATVLVTLLPTLPKTDVEAQFGPHAASIFGGLQESALPKVGLFFAVQGLELLEVGRLASNKDSEELSYAAQAYLAGRVAATDVRGGTLEDTLAMASTPFRSIFGRLNADLAKLPLESEPKPDDIWLIAFSIDVVGSTEGKTRMVAVARNDATRHEAYKNFYGSFLAVEDLFYRRLFNTQVPPGAVPPHVPPLDWHRFFIVKGIGDEIWGLYAVPKDEMQLRQATEQLMRASLDVVDASVQWNSHESLEAVTWDSKIAENQRFDSMMHPMKVFIDFIEDAYEISKVRQTYFHGCVGGYLNLPPGSMINSDFIDLMNKLNAGTNIAAGSKLAQSFRTDYIGHEIDRFFRTSKGALANTVTMGEALFNRVRYATKPTAYPGLFRAEWDNSRGQLETPRQHDTKLYVQEDFDAAELKGIGYSYRVYHFITHQILSKLHVARPNDHLDAGTRQVFPEGMLDSLRTVSQLEQRAATLREVPPPATK